MTAASFNEVEDAHRGSQTTQLIEDLHNVMRTAHRGNAEEAETERVPESDEKENPPTSSDIGPIIIKTREGW